MTELAQILHNAPWVPATMLCIAVVYEFVLGEPPSRLHPVVWMGAIVQRLSRIAPEKGRTRQLIFGAFIALFVPSLFASGAIGVELALRAWPLLMFLVGGVLLSTTFSVRALERAARDMSAALHKPTLNDADRGLLRSLCSRDPSNLNHEQLAAATIESVAENSSDSFVAPLFYFALFGLPGAVFYRAVNTLDAMIGYHGRFEYLGKAAARLDDVLNWIPARICVVLLLIGGAVEGLSWRCGWTIAWRDHGKTESPNAGWPMATMAGLLGIRLIKVEHYALGDPGTTITGEHIDQSCRIARSCFYLSVLSAFGFQTLVQLGIER